MDCPAINNRNEGFIALVGRVVAGQPGITGEEEKRRGGTTDDHYVAIRIVDRARGSPAMSNENETSKDFIVVN